MTITPRQILESLESIGMKPTMERFNFSRQRVYYQLRHLKRTKEGWAFEDKEYVTKKFRGNKLPKNPIELLKLRAEFGRITRIRDHYKIDGNTWKKYKLEHKISIIRDAKSGRDFKFGYRGRVY